VSARGICALLLALTLGAAAPAAAQDPLRHELALQLLEALHTPQQLQASVDAMLSSQLGDNAEARALEPVMRRFFARYFTWDALRDSYADIYAAELSAGDLRDLAAFFRTPVGQRYAAASPRLLQASAALGERMVEAHRAELMQMISEASTPQQMPAPLPAPAPPAPPAPAPRSPG
jgi:hypothetical protein